MRASRHCRMASAPSSNASSRATCPRAGATCCSTTSDAPSIANLSASGIFISAEINDLLVDCMPERMVGCADLEAPTNHKRRLAAFTAEDRSGAYVHCGVREHLMGAMANGMAAHGGIVPLAVTYLAFSDYERPAMRMAALMGLPVKFVFSHDSIGIGRNGPTHQPVEILASLRAMPNMVVMRPADAVEAAECWEVALERRDGPVTLVFARQSLPHVRRLHTSANLSRRGAYVLAEGEGGMREVTLLATGSEVLSRWPRVTPCRRMARRQRWCRCRAGSSSKRRTKPTARACSAPARCAWAAKQPCVSAGTGGSGIEVASSG